MDQSVSDYERARKSFYVGHLNINQTVRIKPALWDPTARVQVWQLVTVFMTLTDHLVRMGYGQFP